MTRSTPSDHTPDDDLAARLDALEPRPGMEPLTAEEKDAFLARVRAEGRALTSAEQYALFGPPREAEMPAPPPPEVEERQPALLDAPTLAQLRANFFPELGDGARLPTISLVRGVIFDFDQTLAELTRPLAELMAEGAQAAAAYMGSAGMDLPDDFATNIVEARRFSEEKSEEEREEHIADDAMSFLLQFFGYPASRMDPDVLRRAVDIFYAPEMTAWRLRPGAQATLAMLQAAGYKLALIANYNCDRVFQRTVDYLGLRPYFDVCLSSAAVEFRKPDPRLFEIPRTRWDALPYEIVVVGDSLRHDIAGGLETGALTVLMEGATTPQVAFDNAQIAGDITPDARVDGLNQLPALIAGWATP
jgi:FMN phosphatase YigB (HAD superfamily)